MKSEQPRVLPARAKINLCLDIRGRRPDGYHELDTVFQRLALHDTVVLYPAETGITVNSDRPDLPAGPKNIAYRAAELLEREYGVRRGVRIRLRKRIPIAAGLGGGSADAAAVLRGLPSIWGLPLLPPDRLLALAGQLGADVPFCLLGVTARAGGIGDLLTPLPAFAGYEVLLVKPAARLATARVYAQFELDKALHPQVGSVVEAIGRGDLESLGQSTGNVLEPPAISCVPEIALIERELRSTGAPVVLMTGSGPTVFALHREKGWAERAARAMARPGWTVIATRTV